MHEPQLLSQEPFVAHKPDDLIRNNVFPKDRAPPPQFYAMTVKMLQVQSFAKLWRISYRSGDFIVTAFSQRQCRFTIRLIPLSFSIAVETEVSMLTATMAARYLLPLSRRNNALVFASNYRGVDGGEGRDELGGADIEDVLALTRIALAHPGWDGKHSLMFGNSRGGMMTYRH